MLLTPRLAVTDVGRLKNIVREHPWATIVTASPNDELMVSHLPIILDESAPELTVLGHLAKTDADQHQLGQQPSVLVMQGPHGYVSPSWYGAGPRVPTWDFVAVHLHGVPTLLNAQQTFHVLDATVRHLERGMPTPWSLDNVPEYAQLLAPATTGFRLVPTRTVGKAKLHQDDTRESALGIAAALEAQPATPSPAALLARAIRDSGPQ